MIRWSGADEVRDDAGEVVAYSRLLLRRLSEAPRPETEPDPAVAQVLSAEGTRHYRNALLSMGHGFGVGALSYFRWVVEDATQGILDLIEDVADAENDEETLERVREARASQEVEEQLRIAVDAVPTSLRDGDVNPLKTLFAQYSKGLPGLQDEQCLEVAGQLRSALEYLFRSWTAQVDEAQAQREEVSEGE